MDTFRQNIFRMTFKKRKKKLTNEILYKLKLTYKHVKN